MFRRTYSRRKPVARAVPRTDVAPARANATLVALALWLSLLTGVAALERIKLPPMPPMQDIPAATLYAGF